MEKKRLECAIMIKAVKMLQEEEQKEKANA